MRSVAVTGSLGTGKSTVAALLAGEDGVLIDADAIVHELLAPGGVAVERVLAAFPNTEAPDGGVDRAALAGQVFHAPSRRTELERLLHPLVVSTTRDRIEAARAAGVPLAVCEVPLLFEAHDAGTAPGSLERFDTVIAVTCDADVQWRRLAARHGTAGVLTADQRRQLEARLAAQIPQDEKARRADETVDNSGSLETLKARVRVLRSRLLDATDASAPSD